MGVYYPQAVMQLRVRLEDFAATKTPTKLLRLHEFIILCKSVKVQLNSYLEADTFDAEIDYKNFPFDPRTIRSVGVSIFIEDKKKIFKSNNALNLLKPSEDNLIFQGFADEDSITLSEETRIIRLEGRDFTSLLIDQEYVGDPINTARPLDQVLRGLLDELEATKSIKLDNQVKDTDGNLVTTLPVVANFSGSKNAESGKKNGRPRKTYWDHIQRLVEQAGLISFISLDKLVVTNPRTLYDRSKAKIFIYGENLKNLEFTRKLGRQRGINIRVISLNLEKKKVVTALIPEGATQAWADSIGVPKSRVKVPDIKADGTQVEGGKDAPFMTFRIPDVALEKQLVEIGQTIFEEVGRQQIEGNLTTKEMQVCQVGEGSEVFNSQKFRVGTPIEINIEQGDMEGLPRLLDIQRKGRRERISPKSQAANQSAIKKFLTRNCYEDQVAEALAESLSRYDTPFFTRSVEFSLDQENGWEMMINFINFIDLPRDLGVANA